MKRKIYLLLIIVTLSSCHKGNNIGNNFITDSNEYWAYYSTNSTQFTYYQFNKDGLSHRFDTDNKQFFTKIKEEEILVKFQENGWSPKIVSCLLEV